MGEQKKHSEAWLICAAFVCVPAWMKDIVHVQYVPAIYQTSFVLMPFAKWFRLIRSDYHVSQLM